jgi:uncharacterized protein YbjT (DUF2867 family)
MHRQKILVTGATGYIGGRLIHPLSMAGHNVRVMTRNASHLHGRSWLKDVEIAQGDVLDAESLSPILADIDVAYYLIHSMGGESGEFTEQDRQAAENFAQAATRAQVKQIIYLGGLGDDTQELSEHLSSRQKVGDILRQHHKGVTEFRAAMVVGSGSLSFEIVRNLTERLPVMITPKWLYTRSQPIAIQDALAYLIAALKRPDTYGQIIEIGGKDVLMYRDMIMAYARARGLKRFLIPVPVLTPRLSSYWVHMVTPVPATLVRPLVEGLRSEMIVTIDSAAALFPEIQPRDFETALHEALNELDAQQVETSWTDSMAATWERDEPYTFVHERGMLIERRMRGVDASSAAMFEAFTSLGGETGWLYLNFLWRLRGRLDRLVGGPGYRRGRPQRENLRIGDALDFWRVEAIEPDQLLLLRAEMKLPGKGWLQFEIETSDSGSNQLVQTAYFAPKGLFGYVYWYSSYFLHKLIYDAMIERVASLAERISSEKQKSPE